MFADLVVVLAVAAAGAIVVYFLFNSVSHVPETKVVADKVAPVKKTSSPKPTKAEVAKKKREEKELEELIAREAVSKSSKGMTATRFEVETLDAHREAALHKARNKKTAAAVAAEKKTEFSEEEKLKERAAGFKVVTKVEEKPASPKTSSPVTAGTRGGSPKVAAVSARDELDKKLSQFFKSNSGKKRGNDFEDFGKPKESEKPKVGGRVEIKKAIAAANEDTWNAEHTW